MPSPRFGWWCVPYLCVLWWRLFPPFFVFLECHCFSGCLIFLKNTFCLLLIFACYDSSCALCVCSFSFSLCEFVSSSQFPLFVVGPPPTFGLVLSPSLLLVGGAFSYLLFVVPSRTVRVVSDCLLPWAGAGAVTLSPFGWRCFSPSSSSFWTVVLFSSVLGW